MSQRQPTMPLFVRLWHRTSSRFGGEANLPTAEAKPEAADAAPFSHTVERCRWHSSAARRLFEGLRALRRRMDGAKVEAVGASASPEVGPAELPGGPTCSEEAGAPLDGVAAMLVPGGRASAEAAAGSASLGAGRPGALARGQERGVTRRRANSWRASGPEVARVLTRRANSYTGVSPGEPHGDRAALPREPTSESMQSMLSASTQRPRGMGPPGSSSGGSSRPARLRQRSGTKVVPLEQFRSLTHTMIIESAIQQDVHTGRARVRSTSRRDSRDRYSRKRSATN